MALVPLVSGLCQVQEALANKACDDTVFTEVRSNMSEIQELFVEAGAIVNEFCAAAEYESGNEWNDKAAGHIGVCWVAPGYFEVWVWDADDPEYPVPQAEGYAGHTPEEALRVAVTCMTAFIADQKAVLAQLQEDARA